MHVDTYPLSPIQQGMLFHWLLDSRSGTDVEQIVGDLDEAIDPERFRDAWQRVVDRVPVLRTLFVWEGRPTPAQGIVEGAVVPFHFEDLSQLDDAQRDEALASFLERDRTEVFDLGSAPSMRVTLFRLAEAKHRMVWTFHHILIDGRSFETILNDVFEQYRDGADLSRAIVDQPYRVYAEWTAQQDSAVAREFWREKLRGFVAPTPVPGGHPIRIGGTRFGESETHLSAATTRGLRDLARRDGLSLNTLVMSAWALLLARYSGEPEVVFGATKTTRRGTVEGAETTPGLFLATIPVRVKIDDDLSVRDWLQQVRAEWLSLRGYEHLPLVDIKGVSDVPSASPLFETLVVFENYQFGTRLRAQGGAWSQRRFRIREQTGLPLTLLAYGDDELVIKMDYDARQFERSQIDRMIRQLVHVLEDWSRDDTQPLWKSSLLSEEDRNRILYGWNATSAGHPSDTSLADLLDAQVERTPHRRAVIAEDQVLSYAELDQRANSLAAELVRRGVGPNVMVGICLERTADLVAAVLAVYKSGGAYVPLDPGFPRDRLASMALDAGLRVLVTHESVTPPAVPPDCTILFVSDALAHAADEVRFRDTAGADDLAYVLYTSGSTGRPKGVEVTRGAFLNFLCAMRDYPGLAGDDVLVGVTTISFDIAGLELFLPLIVGACLVIASREVAANGDALHTLLVDSGATVLQATPTTWRLLLAAGWQGHEHFRALCGGEAMPPELVPELTARCCEVWNMYGPTETTVWSTVHRVLPTDVQILIGRPIASTTTYILDPHGQPVPIGVTGELYIGGAGVARGYRNRPELTAEKFLDDPFRPGERMYRTGDLARFHEDGNIECLGRTDHQVKIRGFRIELGEIEAALLAQPGVAQAVVIAREDIPGDRRLVAYIVADSDTPPADAATLRAALKTTLPDYMLPSAIVPLASMPLTANGKIDRKAFPAPDASSHFARPASRRPRTFTEGLLLDIWSGLFGGSDVGVTDDFFDLGGHSLLAVQLMNRVKEVFGKQLPLNAVFESPTVESLSRHIEDDQTRLGLHALVSVRAVGSRPPIFWIPGGAALGLFTLRGVLTRLSADQPVYGLGSMAPKRIDDVETVEQRAAHYLELIRRQQPHGPYFIAGFCAGGRVAYEMAQQLVNAGEVVAFLGLVNCTVPRFPATRAEKLRFKAQRVLYQLAEARRAGITPVGYARNKLRDRAAARAERERLAASRREVHERGLDSGVVEHNQVLLDATVEVFERYEPRPYRGHVSLFISTEDEELSGVTDDLDPRMRWRQFAASTDVQRFSGGHIAIVEMPRAEAFAAAMQAALDRALSSLQASPRSSVG